MRRILFLPFATPKGSWTGDMAAMLARQVPRHCAVVLSRAEGLEARFAILGRGETGSAPGVPVKLVAPPDVARVVREAAQGDLIVDGVVQLGRFRVRLFKAGDGELLWERRFTWKLPTLQRSIRGIAGGILEKLGRSRGDLAPWISHSPQSFYRFLRAEDQALQVRYGGGERLALRSFAAYRGAVKQDPRFTPAVEGLIRMAASVPAGEALGALRALVGLEYDAEGAAWIARGLSLHGSEEEALPLWRKCLERDPCHPWAARAVGDDLLRARRTDEALALWRRAGADPRADASLVGRLAVLLRRQEQDDEAELVFGRLAGLDGVTPDIWRAYASFLEDRYGPDRAADLFGRALGEGAQPENRMDLGMLLVRAGRQDEAEALGRSLQDRGGKEAHRLGLFLEAAARDPKALARLQLGSRLLDSGRNRAARRHLMAATEAWPHLAEVRYLLGQSCLRLDRHQEGAEALESCLALDASFPGARSKLGIALVALGRFQEAYDHLARALEETPDSVSVLTHLAQACYYLDRKQEGESYVRRARRIDPDHPVVQQTAREFFSL